MDPILIAAFALTITYITSFILLLLAIMFFLNITLPHMNNPSLKFFVLLFAVDLFIFGLSSSIFLSMAFFNPPAAAGMVPFAVAMGRVSISIAASNVLGFFAEAYSLCANRQSLGEGIRTTNTSIFN